MGLEEFEQELAAAKERHEPKQDREDKDHRHHHRHHKHRSDDKRDTNHRHRDDRSSDRHRRKRRRSDGQDAVIVEEPTGKAPATQHAPERERDAWMQAPNALDIDYVQQSQHPKPDKSQFVPAKVHDTSLAAKPSAEKASKPEAESNDIPKIDYTFGDSGSQWRMTKLRGVYRTANEAGLLLDDVAFERYGGFREFDNAREEERELDRRQRYGKGYEMISGPIGDLHRERQTQTQRALEEHESESASFARHDTREPTITRPASLDATALNKLKAQMLKAKLRKDPNAAKLEQDFNAALAQGSTDAPHDIALGHMESRMLTGRENEVKAIDNKRGRERGLVEENEDMTIADMVRQEKRSRNMGNESQNYAERIAKDGKYTDDLDYMDDNAAKLAKHAPKSNINLRNVAINDYQKMQQVLDNCPLCHHEDTGVLPTAPIISLATRVYMTLATEPEVSPGGAVIVPIQHRLNLLECDDDEWEEMRNFMKSLTRMYHARGKGVIFYENAANMAQKRHAALVAIPLPTHLANNAPAFFKEAMLSQDEEWSQHKKVIDTLALAQQPGYGRWAFRKALVKEMAYFHVWFSLDGGMGHVIEDQTRWPKGDLFAREILGGMLDKGPEVIKKQGRWQRQDARLPTFRKQWDQYDWTKALIDAQ